MKLSNHFVLALTFLVSSPLLAAIPASNDIVNRPGFLANLPPGEEIEAPPQPVYENPPVYLDVDSKGNVYRVKAVRNEAGSYTFSDELVTQSTLDEIGAERDIVLLNLENIDLPIESANQASPAAATSSCPLPTSFSIVGDSSGEASGFAKVVNTNRPVGATTQWLTFDFATVDYRNAGGHMAIAPFHEEVVHGWGGIIGNNSGSPDGCGSSAIFNSQIEAWILTDANGDPDTPTATWQAEVFNGSNSCGNEMYDGWINYYGYTGLPPYRMEMQASTGHWVAYRILKLNSVTYNWEVLTDWRGLDVDTGSWPVPPPIFNDDAEGIFMLATDTPSGPWSINVVNTQCGWF